MTNLWIAILTCLFMYIRTYVHTYTTSFNMYIVDIYIFAIVAIYSFLQNLWFDSDIEYIYICLTLCTG